MPAPTPDSKRSPSLPALPGKGTARRIFIDSPRGGSILDTQFVAGNTLARETRIADRGSSSLTREQINASVIGGGDSKLTILLLLKKIALAPKVPKPKGLTFMARLKASLDVLNLPKIFRLAITVRKNPTIEGISAVTSAVDAFLWRPIGSGITGGVGYLYNCTLGKCLSLFTGDFFGKIFFYAASKQALKSAFKDKPLPLLGVILNSLVTRGKGSPPTYVVFSVMTGDPKLAFTMAWVDFLIKFPLHVVFSMGIELWDHAWKFATIPDYARKNSDKKPLLFKIPRIKAFFTKNSPDPVCRGEG